MTKALHLHAIAKAAQWVKSRQTKGNFAGKKLSKLFSLYRIIFLFRLAHLLHCASQSKPGLR